MKWLVKLSSYRANRAPLTGELPKLWADDKISIYEFLHSLPIGNGFSEQKLPDEKPEDGTIRFAPGALDGAFGHHGGGGQDDAKEVFSALQRVCKSLTRHNLTSFYNLLLEDGKALSLADSLVGLIATYSAADKANALRIASWLATQSPDREPVKFGVILLGCLNHAEPPVEVLIALGHHDEFTLYCAVALGKILTGTDREQALWHLAQQVHGWGRIQIVERLADTTNPEIKAWMLRDGYRNSVMYEYLAYICASTGGLLDALREEEPDEALLNGAGEILQSLICGGPCQDISDYADGVETTRLFVNHLARISSPRLKDLVVLASVKRFVENDDWDWASLTENGWSSDIRNEIGAKIDNVRLRPEWPPLIREALSKAADDREFWIATQAAAAIGIDPWDSLFARQQNNRDSQQWFFLMQTDDPDRAARVVQLAEQQLDLLAIAQGPGLETGLGSAFLGHNELDFILQDLGRFPALGWQLVATGLQSPVIRNRHLALRALESWPRDTWPPAALPALDAAFACEPDDKVKERIKDVIAGKEAE